MIKGKGVDRSLVKTPEADVIPTGVKLLGYGLIVPVRHQSSVPQPA
jgi:hypothetical protein